MYKILSLLFLFFFVGCSNHCTMAQQNYLIAPTILQNTSTEMKTPGFWINRLNAPDEVIMTPQEIQNFNQEILKLKLRDDIASFPDSYNGNKLKGILLKQLQETAANKSFKSDGKIASDDFFELIENNLGLENIPQKIEVKFAIVVKNSDQRILPTQEILTQKPFDTDFDELQNNALDINTPVAILWQSIDRVSSYVVGPSSSGWILTQNLALCSREDIKKIHTDDFAIITEAKADIYLDEAKKQFYGFVRMGSCFSIKNLSSEITEIALPLRDEKGLLKMASGYVRIKDISRGYLPYTARMIIEQAFEVLNTPYAWGGANGEQDCSQFLQEVFKTVGIDIPRNSSDQSKVGKLLYEFDENEKDSVIRAQEIILKAQPGLSLMYMKGHIMLYLGEVNKKPYAIHDTWGYRQKIAGKDTPFVINKVTVSDLELGETSKKGSLLNRLKSVRTFEYLQ